MASDRPAKKTVRELWMSRLQDLASSWDERRVLYTTLPGEHAIDLRLMRDRGLLGSEANGAVPISESKKVVAIEHSLNAVAAIRKEFPGLNVIHATLESLVGGATDPSTFPSRKSRNAVVARVVNLDYNSPLNLDVRDGEFLHPQIEAVRKIAVMQRADHGSETWDLFLTLQGEILWSLDCQQHTLAYLRQNAEDSEAFRVACESFFDPDVIDIFDQASSVGLSLGDLPREHQQRVVSAVVPKRIAFVASLAGWKVTTYANWRYGGDDATAPMCTWAFHMERDPRADQNAHAVYLDSVSTILAEAQRIQDDGDLEPRLA